MYDIIKRYVDNENKNGLKEKWSMTDADQRVIRFDIQRTEELLSGFSDEKFII